jgi:hypothetical protein
MRVHSDATCNRIVRAKGYARDARNVRLCDGEPWRQRRMNSVAIGFSTENGKIVESYRQHALCELPYMLKNDLLFLLCHRGWTFVVASLLDGPRRLQSQAASAIHPEVSGRMHRFWANEFPGHFMFERDGSGYAKRPFRQRHGRAWQPLGWRVKMSAVAIAVATNFIGFVQVRDDLARVGRVSID